MAARAEAAKAPKMANMVIRAPARRLIWRGGTWWAWVCLVWPLVLAGCDSPPTAEDQKKNVPIVEVNGEPITRADVRAYFMARENRTRNGDKGLWGAVRDSSEEVPIPRAIVEQLVERRLLLQRFRNSGEYVSDGRVKRFVEIIRLQYGERKLDETMKEEGINRERWLKTMRETLEIELLLEKEVYARLKVSDAEIKAYYKRNLDKFRVGRRWRIRQIVVASEKLASKLRRRILDGESFSALARAHSIGPQRDAGGDLGYFASGELPEYIESVVKSLEPGETSRVFRSPSGFHLLEVSERRFPILRALASVREDIRKQVLVDKGRARLKSWLGKLRRNAKIQYYWENLENGASS